VNSDFIAARSLRNKELSRNSAGHGAEAFALYGDEAPSSIISGRSLVVIRVLCGAELFSTTKDTKAHEGRLRRVSLYSAVLDRP